MNVLKSLFPNLFQRSCFYFNILQLFTRLKGIIPYCSNILANHSTGRQLAAFKSSFPNAGHAELCSFYVNCLRHPDRFYLFVFCAFQKNSSLPSGIRFGNFIFESSRLCVLFPLPTGPLTVSPLLERSVTGLLVMA